MALLTCYHSASHGNAADLDHEEKLNSRFPFVAKADDVCTGPDKSIGIRMHTSRGSIDILHNLPPHTGDIQGPPWRHCSETWDKNHLTLASVPRVSVCSIHQTAQEASAVFLFFHVEKNKIRSGDDSCF